MKTQTLKINKEQAIAELWRRGILKFKCHKVQAEMYDLFYSSPGNSTLVWLLARQTGKSFLLSILALEQAIRHPDSIIKLMTDTKLHVRSIFEKLFDEVMADCPDDLKPKYNESKFTYYFSNGSQIQLAGSDGGHYERLRGQKSHLVLVDEAGFCDKLEDVVKSVLLPTTTHTNGKIVLASTPHSDPDHDFNKFIEEADLNGTLTKKTIFDNPLLSKEQVDRIIREMGGVTAPKFRREYLCEVIRDEESVVFPEFNEDLQKLIVKDWPKPPHFDSYVSMDLGYKDLTVVLFGYYDFRADKVIIEDEIVVKGIDLKLPNLAADILKKETDLWTNVLTGELRTPNRVSDINYIVTSELQRVSDGRLFFDAAKKDDNDAAFNDFRVKLSNQKIIINPRCETFIRHLKNGKRDRKSGKLMRSPDDGHYDALDAGKYLIRQVQFKKNPYPAMYGYNKQDLYVRNKDAFNRVGENSVEIYNKIFNIRKRK